MFTWSISLRGQKIMFSQHNKQLLDDCYDNINGFVSDLKTGKYQIVYHFDKGNESIIYEAFLTPQYRKEHKIVYISFGVRANGEVYYDTDYIYLDEDYSYSRYQHDFAKFILEMDLDLTSNAYLKRYSPIMDEIAPFFNLTKKELLKRSEERKNFLEMINSLSPIAITNGKEEQLVHIQPALRIIFGQSAAMIDLRIGITKYYNINNLSTFLNNVEQEKQVTYGKELSFKHSLSKFDEYSQKLIEILSTRERYYYNDSIKFSTVNEVLKAYMGSYLYLTYIPFNAPRFAPFEDYTKYQVLPNELVGEVKIDENGELKTYPDLKNYDASIKFKRNWFLISKKNFEIAYLKFPSPIVEKIFSYLEEHPSLNYDYIKDIFMDRFLPLLDGKVSIDEKFQSTHSDSLFKINYYVDMTVSGYLHFKTTFTKGKNEITKDEVERNAIYDAKHTAFITVINNLNLVENGDVSDDTTILYFLTNDIATLKKVCDVYISDAISNLKVKTVGKINIQSVFNSDWLDISYSSDEYTNEELEAILSAYKKKKTYIKLRDNIITLDDENISTLASLVDDFDFENDETRVPLYEVFKLNSYGDTFNISYDNQIKHIINDIKNYKTSDYTPSKIYDTILRPYQIDAFKWLSVLKKYKLSGILADDMGLGKTLEMISFITSFETDKPILIVTPKNVIYNWENEFHTWDKKQKVVVIHGFKDYRTKIINNIKNNKKVVYLTSYDGLRGDIELYKDLNFSLMILDEAQYIKNVSALKTKAVKAINAEYRYVLTGTPIENSLYDLWSIFDFLMPHYLYGYKGFKDEYFNLIMSKDQVATKRLRSKISPFILRRVKTDVLKELPPKSESIFKLDMIPPQRELYKAELVKIKKSLNNEITNKIQVLAELTKLRQLCVDPNMIYENFEELPSKLDTALDLIKEALLGGHKVLLFSTFTKALEHLQAILLEENINTYYIYGGTSAKERIAIANNFNRNDSDIKVTLVSLKAGGVGLNLVGADIVIHLDPWWNLAAENQASDRAHRIGQTRPVTIIKLVTKDSIEEKVIELQKKKMALVNDMISDTAESISSLTDEDIAYLLD